MLRGRSAAGRIDYAALGSEVVMDENLVPDANSNVESSSSSANAGTVTNGSTNSTTNDQSTVSKEPDGEMAVTADEVRTIVGETVTDALQGLEGRMTTSADGRKDEILTALGNTATPEELSKVTADATFSYVPDGTPQFVASYMTPFLWGMAAGFVAFLIGYLWEAFARLIGLSGRK